MVNVLKYKRLLSPPADSFFLFGPRGVGKSTWLTQARFNNSVTIDLLSEATYQSFLSEPDLFASRMRALPNGAEVIIDEVQRLPQLLNEVHRFIEQKDLRFILSGSSARKLRRAGTNLLAGRAVKLELFPLTPEELGEDFDLDKVLSIGSLPLLWMRGGDRASMESYVQTYLKEEIQAEALVRNLPGFARFLPVAALFHGQVLNATSLSRDAGVSRSTILNYLEILDDTLLAYRLQPYEGRLRVKETRHPKLYWIDPGIVRSTRRRFGPVLDDERGFLFEGWVAALLKSYQNYRQLFDDWNFWSPTESNNLEVDFLLWKDEQCVAIEVKSSLRWRKEYSKGLLALKESWKEKKSLRCLGLYLGADRLRTADGIDIFPLRDFLTEVEQSRLFLREGR